MISVQYDDYLACDNDITSSSCKQCCQSWKGLKSAVGILKAVGILNLSVKHNLSVGFSEKRCNEGKK